jgi:putative transposase
VRYIDEHVGVRDGDGLRWGVESICDQLTELGAKIAPATYYEHRGRKPTSREQRDEQLKARIAVVHASNYGVYGARKVWLTLNRERPAGEPPIARCTVERLMGEMGLAGAVRGKVKRTTTSDPKTPSRWIWWIATSHRWHQIACGSRTSPMSRRGQAGVTPRS